MNSRITHTNRRDFIKKMSLMLGATAGALLSENALANALAFNTSTKISEYVAKLLTSQQLATLAAIGDCVLPETDTPSASTLGCHVFVDHQLLACHTKEQQDNCLEIINKINNESLRLFNKSYVRISAEQRQGILENLEQTKYFTASDKNQWMFLKSLIIFGYFTTEIGATVVLNYQAVPGGFIGSIPYDQHSKAWGSLGFY